MNYSDEYDDYEVVIGKAADGTVLRGDARDYVNEQPEPDTSAAAYLDPADWEPER